MTTSYKTLAEFHTAKIQARHERDIHANGVAHRWSLLKEPETRGALLRDAMGDMLRNWGPYRRIHELLHGRISGSTVTAVGMAIASTRQGFLKRMIYSGVSMLLGKVIGDEPDTGESVLGKLATTIGGVVRGMRERKAAREEEEEAEAVAANNG